MSRVIDDLQSWANDLEYWKQFALNKLIGGFQANAFSTEDYDLMLQYLLEDAKLSDTTKRKKIEFVSPNNDQDAPKTTKLVSLSKLKNVNALVEDQHLSFGSHLTAVFGGNGAGKSGYSRVLACAGFTRAAYEVLTDVLKAENEAGIPEAIITISDGTTENPLHYVQGKQFPELSSCYVFDTDNVRSLLSKENQMNFSPSGLSYLTEMVVVVDNVKARLQSMVDDKNKPHNFSPYFPGKTPISEEIETLNRLSDLEHLRSLATLTVEDEARMDELDREISSLKARGKEDELKKIQTKIDDSATLLGRLQAVEKNLGASVAHAVQEVVINYQHTEDAAKHIGLDQFKTENFSQVGTPTWQKFITSARDLAVAEQSVGGINRYPSQDDHCLLCNQQLSSEAHTRLHLIWQFLEAGVEKRFIDASQKIVEMREILSNIELDFVDDDSVFARLIAELSPELLPIVRNYLATAHSRKNKLLENLDQISFTTTPELTQVPVFNIQILINEMEATRDRLEKENVTERISELSKELLTLQHRKILNEMLSDIEIHLRDKKWAYQAAKHLPSTNAITTKHNQLLEELVNKNYLELFQTNLKEIGCPLSVVVETRGRKGRNFRQIVIKSENPEAKPDKILSEGEKRAVAMADFLTEIAMDTNCSCIIFDDPVTSLDIEWKEIIAHRIAAEAKIRQVIVFTHDLHFLHLLESKTSAIEVEILVHWVERGLLDDRPGYVHQNNSPLTEKNYRKPDRAEQFLIESENAPPEKRETLLQQGFGALRTTYEVFIMRTMFKDAATRWSEHVKFTVVRDIKWDVKIADEVVQKCELLSRYIEGHSHSDEYSSKKPTPSTLKLEIEGFKDLKKRWDNIT